MQKRLQVPGIVKIAGLAPKKYVRRKSSACDRLFSKLLELVREKNEPTTHQSGRENHAKSGKNAANASCVEIKVAKTATTQRSEYQSGYEIPGNHEEYVDTDKSARQAAGEGVKDNHADDRDRSQSVDIGAVVQTRRRPLVCSADCAVIAWSGCLLYFFERVFRPSAPNPRPLRA